jgi:hypothetical protein
MNADDKKNGLLKDDDFVLVRTKDGKMMYRHKGEYYTAEEAEKRLRGSSPANGGVRMTARATGEFEELKAEDGATDAKKQTDEIIQQTVAQIIKELKLTFAADAKKQKFAKILESFLREIRTPKEFLYILTAPEASAGFGITTEKADNIVNASKRHLDILHEKRRKALAPKVESKGFFPRQGEVRMTEAQGVGRLTTVAPLVKKIELPASPAGAPKAAVKKPTADVKYTPKLVGPVEELLTLDVVSFHRLGKDGKERLEELKEKFALLQEESLEKWILGKQNWTKSPVYAAYLEIGMKSLKENKPVNALLAGDFTMDDFATILELNKWLNY